MVKKINLIIIHILYNINISLKTIPIKILKMYQFYYVMDYVIYDIEYFHFTFFVRNDEIECIDERRRSNIFWNIYEYKY